MKKILIAGLCGLFVVSACSQKGNAVQKNTEQEVKIEGAVIEPQIQNTAKSEVKSFAVTATKWQFDPHTIGVRLGDTVRLTIHSADVAHGVSIPDFNINQVIDPGETIDIEFVANKKGTFDIFCSVYCGTGHPSMKGRLIVQ